MGPYARLLRRIGRWRPVAAIAARTQTPVDRYLMHHWGGRIRTMGTLPTLLLTTTGRRTGATHETPLLYFATTDGTLVVTDTNYGRASRPAWSHNLTGDGPSIVEVDGARFGVTARLASDEERPALWDGLVGVWPAFGDYAARLERTPSVWVLAPSG